MEPLERVAILLALMRQLREALQHETLCLRAMRLSRLEQLQAEQATLDEAYELELRALRRAPEILGALPAGIRAALEAETREVQAARRINAEARRAARAVMEALVRRLSESLGALTPETRSRAVAAKGRVIWGAFRSG
jgi:hypothetical protein